MIRPFLRHWMLLDLDWFRRWATDKRVKHVPLIDNKDGTFGRAFDLQWFPAEGVIALSDTMKVALEHGISAIEPLPSTPPRGIRPGPDLQELVARFGGYNRITVQAWAEYDRERKQWETDLRLGLIDLPDDEGAR